MPGQRHRLMADAFHQIAVGAQHIGVMIDQTVAKFRIEVALPQRHADGC